MDERVENNANNEYWYTGQTNVSLVTLSKLSSTELYTSRMRFQNTQISLVCGGRGNISL